MDENGVTSTKLLYLHTNRQYCLKNLGSTRPAVYIHRSKDLPTAIAKASPILLMLIQPHRPHWTYLSFLQIADFVFKNCYNLSYWSIVCSLRRGWFFRLSIRSRRHPSQATTFPGLRMVVVVVEEIEFSIYPSNLQNNCHSFKKE